MCRSGFETASSVVPRKYFTKYGFILGVPPEADRVSGVRSDISEYGRQISGHGGSDINNGNADLSLQYENQANGVIDSDLSSDT
jgi:hypothetical protein